MMPKFRLPVELMLTTPPSALTGVLKFSVRELTTMVAMYGRSSSTYTIVRAYTCAYRRVRWSESSKVQADILTVTGVDTRPHMLAFSTTQKRWTHTQSSVIFAATTDLKSNEDRNETISWQGGEGRRAVKNEQYQWSRPHRSEKKKKRKEKRTEKQNNAEKQEKK